MASSRTISELKSSFIRSQIRILSERLEPEEGWEDYGPQSEDLSEKVVEEALQKCKRAFQYSQMGFTLGSMIWLCSEHDYKTTQSGRVFLTSSPSYCSPDREPVLGFSQSSYPWSRISGGRCRERDGFIKSYVVIDWASQIPWMLALILLSKENWEVASRMGGTRRGRR